MVLRSIFWTLILKPGDFAFAYASLSYALKLLALGSRAARICRVIKRSLAGDDNDR